MSTYRVPVSVLQRIWALCAANVEFAGQMLPHMDENNQCVLHSSEAYHSKVGRSSVPFHESAIAQSRLGCHGNAINVFYHTHPLSVVAQKGFGRYAPPSMHDFFAHCVLSNYRNWKANGQINTAAVMATEGFYVYHVVPQRFVQLVDRINTMFVAQPRSAKAKDDFMIGHLPQDIVDDLRKEHYDALKDAFVQFINDMKMACEDNSNYALDTGQFYVTMKNDMEWIEDNVYHERLQQCGFFYDFYPAPFEEDISILTADKIRLAW